MTTVHTSGTQFPTGIAGPRPFRRITRSPGRLMRDAGGEGLSLNATPEEVRELVVLEEFLTSHIQKDGLRTVQCMLLWSEWVRTYNRETKKFPAVILEKEFRRAVTTRLGLDITDDETRGTVYPGIRFVP